MLPTPQLHSRCVGLGCQAVRTGDANIVVCGGQESMSRAPHAIHLRTPTKMGSTTLTDTMITDGLTDAFHNYHMGVTGEKMCLLKNVFSLQYKWAIV